MTVLSVSRAAAAPSLVPPLREGDRMDADEFVRRWQAMPEPRPKCELLEGEVHFMSPITETNHSGPQFDLLALLGAYRAATPGTFGGGPVSLRLGAFNLPEPDGYLRVLESHGGRTHRRADDYVEGVPELVLEISGSSTSRDLGVKFQLYQNYGAGEYLLWRTAAGELSWYARGADGRLLPLAAGADGLLRSAAFPGLWLNVAALLRGDLAAALTSLQLGLASPEHAAFVEQLRQRAANVPSPIQPNPTQPNPTQLPTEGAMP